jgi:hypothetical protein
MRYFWTLQIFMGISMAIRLGSQEGFWFAIGGFFIVAPVAAFLAWVLTAYDRRHAPQP